VVSSKTVAGNDMDFTKTTLYETLTAELLTYKRQRDNAKEKAARYKSQWNETAEELKHQTSKFELLAKEFRRIIKMEEKAYKRSSEGSIENKDRK
jgi:sugar-specific transcriptional regulator TrmB